MTENNEALTQLDDLAAAVLEAAATEICRLQAEVKALRAAVAAVRFQCEADAKSGEWTTCITKLLDAIKAVEEGK